MNDWIIVIIVIYFIAHLLAGPLDWYYIYKIFKKGEKMPEKKHVIKKIVVHYYDQPPLEIDEYEIEKMEELEKAISLIDRARSVYGDLSRLFK